MGFFVFFFLSLLLLLGLGSGGGAGQEGIYLFRHCLWVLVFVISGFWMVMGLWFGFFFTCYVF